MTSSWETPDIALAAWVSLKGEEHGVRLVKVDRARGNGRQPSIFVFRGPIERIDELIAAFPSSEAHRFDAMVRSLKSISHSRNR